ncbi:MAG: hypothetical protein JNL38_32485 [Myxococcales bacterium]|jgi:histidine triad (HIT) family protein|nr:hypothetical protein [Myxococcales bacterium]
MRMLSKQEAQGLLREEVLQLSPEFGACLPCAVAAKDYAPHLLVRENDVGVCIVEQFAARSGHLVVVPKQHVETMQEVPWSLYRDLQYLAWEAAVTVEKLLQPKRVFVAQLGSVKQRTTAFNHVTINIVPIYEADDRARPSHVFSWSRGVYHYEDAEADDLAERIRQAWG